MLISIDRGSARNSCNTKPNHAHWSAQRAYNGQLLQLLRALLLQHRARWSTLMNIYAQAGLTVS